MNQDLLIKIIDADLSRDVKEKVLLYWLLPHTDSATTPIQKNDTKLGAIRRPDKKELDLRANPKAREEEQAMEESLEKVVGDDE